MSSHNDGLSNPTLSLIVPQHLVKTVKDALQAANILNKSTKIHKVDSNTPFHKPDNYPIGASTEAHYSIATTYTLPTPISTPQTIQEALHQLLDSSSLLHLKHLIGYTTTITTHPSLPLNPAIPPSSKNNNNPLTRTLQTWLLSLPPNLNDAALTHALSQTWSYTIYAPMLLLPSIDAWSLLLTTPFNPHHQQLWTALCDVFGVTHVALNGVIPSSLTSERSDDDSASTESMEGGKSNPNILRSPTNLTPFHGDFGPLLPAPPSHDPSIKDFEDAFWCTAVQNGIVQMWAPRYSMFSRGNGREKTRLLGLSSLIKEGLGRVGGNRGDGDGHGHGAKGISAVDLYAGIGYFAFSYAKAGVGRVLCWELNGWSVEGLRRGAGENGWGCWVVESGEEWKGGEEQLVVFKESNEMAVKRIDGMRGEIPPVRHVNCGFLPSSSDSWGIAVQVLDTVLGGWIHAHENVNTKDVERREEEVVEIFTALVSTHRRGSLREHARVTCEHVEIVKSYGPRVSHCVFDIAILPP